MYEVIVKADFFFLPRLIPSNGLTRWINMLSVWRGRGDLRFRFSSIISKAQSSCVFFFCYQVHHFPGPFSQGSAHPSVTTLEIPCAIESRGILGLVWGSFYGLWWFILCVYMVEPDKPKVSGWTLSRCVHFVKRFTFDLSVWARLVPPVQAPKGHKAEGENFFSAFNHLSGTLQNSV